MTHISVATCLVSLFVIILIQSIFEYPIVHGVNMQETSNNAEATCRPEFSIGMKFPNHLGRRIALLTLIPRSRDSNLSDKLPVWIESTELKSLCFYLGVIKSTGESFQAHLSIDGFLRSTLHYEGKWYNLLFPINATNSVSVTLIDKVKDNPETRLVTEWSDMSSHHMVCQGCSNSAWNPSRHSRVKRDLKLQSFNQLATRRVLELMVVADSRYIATFGQDGAIARILQMVSYANGAYQTLGLQIILVKIVSLTADQFNATQELQTLLHSFNAYKAFKIDGRYDAAILLVPNQVTNTVGDSSTNTSFGGWANGLCDSARSSGVVSDTNGTIQAALGMVRTIGIMLGFKFDEAVRDCACSELIGCYMSSRKFFDNTAQLYGWSSCSLDSWRTQADATWRECLKDSPSVSYTFTPATQCGNGIVDSGEQCDCGPALACKSTCCSPNTCMLKSGAQCANGACCNGTTCKLKTKGQVCRDSDGTCDVVETCDGLTEWCPADDKVANGVQCDSSSYCYNGACKSSRNQCKLLYDSTATVADPICFSTLNTATDAPGFCSVSLSYYNATGFLQFNSSRCSNRDSVCGLLHCSVSHIPLNGRVYTSGASTCYSQFGADTASSGIRNGILVPDGVACGTQAMCVNSVCQPVSNFACANCPNCHGNGNLTQAKVCYCKPGFAPPDCSSAGCGGSVTSQYVCDHNSPGSPDLLVIIAATVASGVAIIIIIIVIVVVVKKRQAKGKSEANTDTHSAESQRTTINNGYTFSNGLFDPRVTTVSNNVRMEEPEEEYETIQENHESAHYVMD